MATGASGSISSGGAVGTRCLTAGKPSGRSPSASSRCAQPPDLTGIATVNLPGPMPPVLTRTSAPWPSPARWSSTFEVASAAEAARQPPGLIPISKGRVPMCKPKASSEAPARLQPTAATSETGGSENGQWDSAPASVNRRDGSRGRRCRRWQLPRLAVQSKSDKGYEARVASRNSFETTRAIRTFVNNQRLILGDNLNAPENSRPEAPLLIVKATASVAVAVLYERDNSVKPGLGVFFINAFTLGTRWRQGRAA